MKDSDWNIVEQCLKSPNHPVGLTCDGYHVCLNLGRSGMKLIIEIYVNGSIKGVWTRDDCEERRRFLRPAKKSAWSAKSLAEIKTMSAAQLKRMKIDPKETFVVYYPWWTNYKALRSHLIKNNKSIELAPDWKYAGVLED